MVKCRKAKCAVYSHKTGKRLTKFAGKKATNRKLRLINYFKNKAR